MEMIRKTNARINPASVKDAFAMIEPPAWPKKISPHGANSVNSNLYLRYGCMKIYNWFLGEEKHSRTTIIPLNNDQTTPMNKCCRDLFFFFFFQE